MIRGKKVVVAMPAYNAEKTLEKTYSEIPRDVVDLVILVDDASQDGTVALAQKLAIDIIIRHDKNMGYGGNQKTCYREALKNAAGIIIMLHPDYQYTPALIEPMAWLVASGTYDVALASRILGNDALRGGMPFYKYFANRALTLIENILLWQHLSEYHTGYRVYSRDVLESLPFTNNSNGFAFDNEFLAQAFYAGFRVGELSCPTKYFPDASSINFVDSVKYGIGVLGVGCLYRFHHWRFYRYHILEGLTQDAVKQNLSTT
jgi:glycosyltransferase involved in cell wall biosynthesis